MKVVTYMCENCFEPYVFNSEEDDGNFLCPKCGEKMMYFCTEEIDVQTKKVVKRYDDETRRQQNPGVCSHHIFSSQPTITCPYCQSTNVSKIGTLGRMVSVGFWGLASGKVGKQWHCNKCGSDF